VICAWSENTKKSLSPANTWCSSGKSKSYGRLFSVAPLSDEPTRTNDRLYQGHKGYHRPPPPLFTKHSMSRLHSAYFKALLPYVETNVGIISVESSFSSFLHPGPGRLPLLLPGWDICLCAPELLAVITWYMSASESVSGVTWECNKAWAPGAMWYLCLIAGLWLPSHVPGSVSVL
jgi:hypothetical protein